MNDRYATSIPGVYAAGDVIGGVLLAHTATFEAVQAVEGMFNPDYQPAGRLLPKLHVLLPAGGFRG